VLAQLSISPNATPTLNTGGWVYGSAVLLAAIGGLVVAVIVLAYMRYAPRFRRDEGAPRSVRAPRLQPGREAPRRAVKITGSPATVPAPVAASTPAAAATTTAAAPAAASTTTAPAATATATVTAPAATETAAAPVAATEERPAASEAAPAAGASPAATPAAQAAPAPASGEHKEVSLDQETYDAKLAELLAKGTDRRVAEGQARRAAMIAARQKAEA
jgi:hypothetical protein